MFRSQNDSSGVARTFLLLFLFSDLEGKLLQIRKPASFASNSLSIPFPKDRRQVFLDRHLLSVAAVAVCEDAVWVPLGQGLWAVLHRFPPAVWEGDMQTRGRFDFQHMMISYSHASPPLPACTAMWCWAKELWTLEWDLLVKSCRSQIGRIKEGNWVFRTRRSVLHNGAAIFWYIISFV